MRKKLPRVKLVCHFCGSGFERKESEIYGKHQFCSVKCHDDFRRIKRCVVCGSDQLYTPGWKINTPVCKNCFGEWKKHRNRESSIKKVSELQPHYLRALLICTGIITRTDKVPDQLMQIKREQLSMKRELKQIKEAINGAD